MYKIFGYIGLGIVLLLPYIYFFVTYSNMKKEIGNQKVMITNLEQVNKTLVENNKAKDAALVKCQEDAKKIADTAAKIDKNNKDNSSTKDKIDKVIDNKKKKVIIKKSPKKAELDTSYRTCASTKHYTKLINELYE